jgi:Ca-activated chloride channel family protein
MERKVRHGARFALAGMMLATLFLSCRGRHPEERPAQEASTVSSDPDALHLLFTYGSEKEAWIAEVTRRFNEERHRTATGKVIAVEAVPQGSGELIEDLAAGVRQAHLTSPASALFVQLGNAQSRARTGKDLIGETRNLVLSPLVIAMWRPMAEALGWPGKRIGWGEILAVVRDPGGWSSRGHPEWGAFRFGHTHPEYSNSGLLSLLAEAYAASGKVAGLTLADLAKPDTARTVAAIESAVVHYGSSTGFFGKRLFEGGPGYLSAAVLYENMVIESYGPQYHLPLPVVALYPKEGTFWSDHPVGLVEREWVTPEHREAAELYIDYLLARPQQETALRFGFRPAAVEVPLGAPIDAAHGVDPKEPQTTLEVPPVGVVDATLTLWRRNKKRSDITLVLDRSGSMKEERRMENAQAGARQLVELLDTEDIFSLLAFSDRLDWVVSGEPLATARAKVLGAVASTFAEGGTALYDAVAAAYDRKLAEVRREPRRIAAIVVLTDGDDTDSALDLEALLTKVRAGDESRGVRVFTIAYGDGANRKVLEAIADATEAKFYRGSPSNIRTVFREISTFF